ncbi:MAG: sensor histidine kinase [Bacteroidaceae bacterium]|nr:sensor histidine kinase [Bacteroidaceae bacterium]
MLYIIISIVIVILAICFYHHQTILRDRAYLMREAIRNHDFTFHLPVKGLFFGERALQEALNDLGKDISSLVAQNEVESWQKLTRVLTHEIMNATTPICSISQAYLNNPQIKGTPYEEGIRTIYDTTRGLSTFVDSYRKFTQLQEPVPTDIILVDLINSLKLLYKDIEWNVSIPSETTIHADENLIRQVLINITKNAIEAGAKKMDIRWNNALYISNNGVPIPAGARREIFIPFFTTKSNGSGIGLALSRQIIMRQGMNLRLADTPVSGYHTTFIIE